MTSVYSRSGSQRRHPFRTAGPRHMLFAGACALLLLLAAVTSGASPAKASTGGDRFWAGKVYRGEFGAPSLLRVGSTYYAYATNTDGNNLPVMTSTDLVTCHAGSRYAIGYATCAGPLGPCRRGSGRPLLATGGSVAGRGAQAPIVDKNGRLRLAYSAWTAGHVGYPSSGSCR